MPSGTATQKSSHLVGNAASTHDTGAAPGRDALDGAISQSLRHQRRPSISPSAPAASSPLTEDALLRYLDGSLDTQTHAQVEQQLLRSPTQRTQLAMLKAALDRQAAPQAAAAATTARLVLCWFGETLCFLRGSCEALDAAPEPGSARNPSGNSYKPTYKFSYRFPSADTLLKVSPSNDQTLDLELTVSHAAAPLAGEVNLMHQGAVVRSITLEGGCLSLAGLAVARHELQLRVADATVGTVVLDLRRA